VKYSGFILVWTWFLRHQRRLEYDFVVAPGADRGYCFAVNGAKKMRINSRGDLVLSIAGGEVELRKPVVYQSVKANDERFASRYVLAGTGVFRSR